MTGDEPAGPVGPPLIVTVHDSRGWVVFRGAATGEDTIKITHAAPGESRLICDIGDLTAWIRKETT